MTDRQDKILEILARGQRVEVSVLADVLAVSQVTIRKDLDQLEEKGFIKREHGFALFGPIDDVGRRMAVNYEVKRKIAKAAAELVEEDETVLIESGSCCALLAEELANTKPGVTIITNSAFIANHIRHAPHANVILLGGEYQNESQMLVGSMTSKWAEIFMSDKFFIGTDGFTQKYGFTGRDHLRTQTVRDMAQQAGRIIVLTDSDKFSHQGDEGLVRTEQVSAVFTDTQISGEMESFLTGQGVTVYKVPRNCAVREGGQESGQENSRPEPEEKVALPVM
ncbi:MAG: DeoR/GlpR family DNA-binding transcription regulator [Treponema sp.]|jgi:DeoR/GlpR family transcriptional regulator of sugar metabolism|nr:DeoR/GlpR family DNA-binding transcription regulator [Treponema sp.]